MRESSIRRPARVTSRAPGSSSRSAKRSVPAAGVAAAQQRAQPGLQLAQGERLDQVVVGARVEPGDAVVDRVARREHEDGGAVAGRAQPAAHLEPVDARHRHVEHDRVDVVADEVVERRAAVLGHVHVVAVERQRALQRLAHGRLVVDHQHLHRG